MVFIQKVSNFLKEPIAFFCKDCNEIVQVRPLGRKFVYRCSKCGTKNVAFGTEKSIRSFYRIPEEVAVEEVGTEKEIVEAEKKLPENK
jgi:DNA-directed RNA polymerase subunit M/transcription elongation factor TFIIS